MGSGHSVLRADATTETTAKRKLENVDGIVTATGGRPQLTDRLLEEIARTWQLHWEKQICNYWRSCCANLYIYLLSNKCITQTHLDTFTEHACFNLPCLHSRWTEGTTCEFLAYCTANADPLRFMWVPDYFWGLAHWPTYRWPGDLNFHLSQSNPYSRFRVIEVCSQERVTIDMALHNHNSEFQISIAFATETTDMQHLEWSEWREDLDNEDSEYDGEDTKKMEEVVVEAEWDVVLRMVFVAVHRRSNDEGDANFREHPPTDILLSGDHHLRRAPARDVVYTIIFADRQHARQQATLVTFHWQLVIALAMGWHPRLGANSILQYLDKDLLQIIAKCALYTTEDVNSGLLERMSSKPHITSGTRLP